MNDKVSQLQRRYESILNSAGQGIYGLDIEGRATFINPAAAKMTGWRADEIIGKAVHEIHHHTKADGNPYPREECPIYAALKDGVVHCIDNEVFWRKDGSWFPVRYTSTPIIENNVVVGAVVVFQDTTEQKRTETALSQLQQRNELILSAAGEGIYGLDCEGNTTFVNPAAAKMLGWTSEELIGQPMHSLLHHTHSDGLHYPREACPIYAAFKDGAIHQVNDEVFWRKDNSCFPVEYTSTPIRESSRLVGAVVVFRDITERKHAEKMIRQAQVEIAVAQSEMKIARQIQESLLPSAPLMLGSIEIAGYCLPATAVGGDYFDYFCSDDDNVSVVIADVSGHSIGSGLFMIETRASLRAQANVVKSPGNTLSALNDLLYEDLNQADHFITMFYIQYDAVTAKITYANAGHCRPLLIRESDLSSDELDAEGLVLGVKKNVYFEEKILSLRKDDMVFLYTDGITEAENQKGEFFGTNRLSNILNNYAHLQPQELIKMVIIDLQAFSQRKSFNDDVTMVVFKLRNQLSGVQELR